MTRKVVCFALWVWTGLVFAVDDPLEDLETHDRSGIEEREPWKEAVVRLPNYPKERDLIEVELEGAPTPFRVYVDAKSLAIGKDGVVRYTAVLMSSSGARNVLYEGLRCDEGLYKTYAYGVTGNRFQETTVPEWKDVYNTGAMRFRNDFYRFFMCDEYGLSYPRKAIIARLKNPKETGFRNSLP